MPDKGSIPSVSKPIQPMQKRLKIVWVGWLTYRLLLVPTLLGGLHPMHPDIVGGIAWQLLWLLPALLLSPWMLKGKSAYMLLVGSMLTLVYLGASGVTVFSRFYDNGLSVIWIYILDLVLIFLVNYYIFVLLKRLPSMNGQSKVVDKNKR